MKIEEEIWNLAHSANSEDRREWAVLYWKSQGLKHKEIANQWNYSIQWVQRYMTRTYERFGIPKNLDKYQKFEMLENMVFPKLREFIAGEPNILKELPPPPVGQPTPPEPIIEDPFDIAKPKDTPIEVVSPKVIYLPERHDNHLVMLLRRIILLIIVVGVLGSVGYIAYLSGKSSGNATVAITQVITQVLPQPTTPPALAVVPTGVPSIVPTDTLPPTQAPTFTAVPTVFVPPANRILFQDNFDSGLNSAWQLISGQPSIVNGALTTSEDTWLKLSDSSWKNFTITIEMTGNDCWFSSSYNAIGVRGKATNNMVAFRWANCENEWDVVTSGNWKQVANSHFEGNIWGPVVYTIEVKDNQFSASVADQFNTSIVLLNEDLQPGTIFLKLAPKTLIDSFKIVENP